MLAIELVKILLGAGAGVMGLSGIMITCDPISDDKTGFTFLILTIIALILVFNI